MDPIIAIAAALIVAVLITAVVFAAVKRRKGCCQSDEEIEKRIKVADRNAAHYPYCVRLSIAGMTCQKCRLRVENALNAKGTLWATADLKDGSALVRMKEELPDDTLRRIVAREGFTVVGIEKLF